MKMGLDVGKLVLQSTGSGTVAIVAGDGDFLPVVEIVQENQWKAEVWYWSNASGELQRAADRFEALDAAVYTFGFDAR